MRLRKDIVKICISFLIVFSMIFSLPFGIIGFAAEPINGTVDFEKYTFGYPQTSENGIIVNTDKNNSADGKYSLRYGYDKDIENAKNGAFALLSFGNSKTIELKEATMYSIEFSYMLKGGTGCSVDLAFFSSSALTPNSSKYREEIGRAEKIVTVNTAKNVWHKKKVNIATNTAFNSLSGEDCNSLAIGFYPYIDVGMGTNVYIYLDAVMINEIGPAPTYTIKFNSNGGNDITEISGLLNKEIVLPETPQKHGYVFAGWYTDQALSKKFSDGLFTRDLTLYAKWIGENGYYIDFNSDKYNSPYKDSVGIQTAISNEKFNSPGKSLKYRNIGAYGARRLLITEDGSRVTVKNHTLYQIKFSYRNYSQTPAYFETITSGTSLYTGTQVFGGTFVLSTEDEWKNATYYVYTELFAEEENYLAFYINGDDNAKSDIFIDDIEITEVSVPNDHPVIMIIDHNDGENSSYMTGKEEAPLVITEPIREGYKFLGWCEDNWYINDFYDDAFYYSKKIYAKWAKLKQIQNFDDTYNHTGRSLGYDLDIEIYDSAKSGNSISNAVSTPNSIHRIGNSDLKKGFVIFDSSMEQLMPDQNYLISFSVKVDKVTDPDAMIEIAQTRARDYAWACDDDGNYPIVSISELKKDQWVRVSYIMTVYEKYLSIFTTGKNSLYFDDFSIEWIPYDVEFENDESVIITELDITDSFLTNNQPPPSTSGKDGVSPNTGERTVIILNCIICLLSACAIVAAYGHIEKRKGWKNGKNKF